MENEKRIILNRIQTPDGTVLISYHRHDYKEHVDKNGECYMVDGGTDYLRRSSGHKEDYIEMSLYEDSPYEEIRKYYCRGGRGKNGDQPLTWVPLKDMSDEWLFNCVDYNKKLGFGKSFATKMYLTELRYRSKLKISIKD